ncbi:hypothetical protein [Mycobacterium phage Guo1]|nr:hypothetical protein [Mycobacterium phage Guo1]
MLFARCATVEPDQVPAVGVSAARAELVGRNLGEPEHDPLRVRCAGVHPLPELGVVADVLQVRNPVRADRAARADALGALAQPGSVDLVVLP